MLWIEKYRPHDFSDLRGQDHVIRHLSSFAQQKNVPHLLLIGPHGTGKSSALECLARSLYGDYWQENTSIFNTSELFLQGKSYLQNDERFSHLFQKNASLIRNFKYIVKWYASLRPLDAEFKLMIFEDAGALTFEAQQALRRIMEHYSTTCRFIFCAKNQSGIIPAITSRCLPLYFSPLDEETILAHINDILLKEGILERIPKEDLELVVQTSQGDLRKAIMLLELSVRTGKEVDLADLSQSETAAITSAMFDALRSQDMEKAKALAGTLMFDYGLTGSEIIEELRKTARTEYNAPIIATAIAQTEFGLGHSGTEIIHIEALLARIIEEVFT
jgi:replication factor C small subunit